MHWLIKTELSQDKERNCSLVASVLLEPLGFRQIKRATGLSSHQTAIAIARMLKRRRVFKVGENQFRRR